MIVGTEKILREASVDALDYHKRNDVDVCHNDAVGRFTSSASLGLLCEEVDYSSERKGECLHH